MRRQNDSSPEPGLVAATMRHGSNRSGYPPDTTSTSNGMCASLPPEVAPPAPLSQTPGVQRDTPTLTTDGKRFYATGVRIGRDAGGSAAEGNGGLRRFFKR